MTADITSLTLCTAADGLRRKEFSSVELTRTVLDAIAARDGVIGAFLSVDRDGALQQAAASDAARAAGRDGELLGVPVAIKDIINVEGQPCTCASRILEGYVAPFDATVTARLRAEGTVFAGRTNMDEFAMGSANEHSAFKPVRNPVALDHVPGGSSGGSAAAVVGGMALAALGTDTGGSIRQPASFCGCVGLKPSYGRVSRFGVTAFASSLDQVGPITKNVEDAAVLLRALSGRDDHDQTVLDAPVPDYRAALAKASLKGVRIGLPKEYFVDGVDRQVMARVRAAADACAAMGAEVGEVSLPHSEYAVAVYFICATAEASANLARFDGVRYGRRVPGESVQDMYIRTRSEGFGKEVKRRIILGTYVLSSGYYDAYYTRALKARTLIRRDFEEAFKQYDVLLTPVSPTPAYKLGTKEVDPLKIYLGDIFTVSANLAGVCGISVPCGATAEGLPVGVQLLGPAMGEERLLQAAYAYEQGGARMNYVPSIGLEIHVQLKTESKMFCNCGTGFAAEPNTQVCPICLGYPGALPLMNREAIKKTVLAGLMLGCRINPYSKFDRKNYFYPDVAKNYQITQYDKPLCLGGQVTFRNGSDEKTINLTRIHLEEDVAKNTHHPRCSGVDFNRAGLPLMEIVSEPEMGSPEEAFAFLQALRQILVYAGVSDCNLEEGNLRCDVNISVRPEGTQTLGTKVEIKNMNTFRGILAALRYEIGRQMDVVRRGGRLVQETRRWDPELGGTTTMRSKENAHDYRYFPEPDLLPIALDAVQIEEWRALLPELPAHKRERFTVQYGLPSYDAGVLTAQLPVSAFFETASAKCGNPKAVSNWIMTDLLRSLGATEKDILDVPLTPAALAELVALVDAKTINMPTAKELFNELFEKGGMPATMVKERGLAQVSDTDAIAKFAAEVVAANPKVVADFVGGKAAALQFLVGQVMKLSKGKANPKMAGDLIAEAIRKATPLS